MLDKTKLVIGVAIIGVIGMQYLQIHSLKGSLKTETENSAKLEQAVNTQTDTIKTMSTQMTAMVVSANHLSGIITDIETKRNRKIAELNGYLGRLANASLKKPKLVEKLANRATKDVIKSFEDASTSNKKDKPDD